MRIIRQYLLSFIHLASGHSARETGSTQQKIRSPASASPLHSASVVISRCPIAPKLSGMATAVASIALSGPAAFLCASQRSNRSRICSSSSVLALPVKGLQSVNLRAKGVGCVRAGERVDVDVKEAGAKGDVLPSGEWPENFSLLNYEDLSKYYEDVLFKPEVSA